MDCVAWFLSYAADEFTYRNVVREEVEVADKMVEWDFNKGIFTAIVRLHGVIKQITMSPTKMPSRVRNFMRESDGVAQGYSSKASFKLKKEVCREYCSRWADAVLDGQQMLFEDLCRKSSFAVADLAPEAEHTAVADVGSNDVGSSDGDASEEDPGTFKRCCSSPEIATTDSKEDSPPHGAAVPVP